MKFSVVVPNYNGFPFLPACISSIFSQTYSDFELILIDNNSSDSSIEYLSLVGDSRLRLVTINNGGCIARSRNLGLELSRGEYVAFLDADDIWSGDKLEVIARKLSAKNYDLACHDEYIIDENSKTLGVLRYSRYPSRHLLACLLLGGNQISTSTVVISRAFIERHQLRFEESFDINSAEDYDFWIRCASVGPSFVKISQCLGYYRLHPRSASSDNYRNYLATTRVIKQFLIRRFGRDTIGYELNEVITAKYMNYEVFRQILCSSPGFKTILRFLVLRPISGLLGLTIRRIF